MKIGDKYSGDVQDYGKTPEIEGVRLEELSRFSDCGGSFNEVARLAAGRIDDFEVKQINFSEIMPGTVKAGHYHMEQDDLWFVPANSRLLVGLKDLREDSGSYEVVKRLIMGDGKTHLLFIPKGVLHGVANLWTESANLIYLVNQNFNPENPDEHRLPPEEFGENFWEIARG